MEAGNDFKMIFRAEVNKTFNAAAIRSFPFRKHSEKHEEREAILIIRDWDLIQLIFDRATESHKKISFFSSSELISTKQRPRPETKGSNFWSFPDSLSGCPCWIKADWVRLKSLFGSHQTSVQEQSCLKDVVIRRKRQSFMVSGMLFWLLMTWGGLGNDVLKISSWKFRKNWFDAANFILEFELKKQLCFKKFKRKPSEKQTMIGFEPKFNFCLELTAKFKPRACKHFWKRTN